MAVNEPPYLTVGTDVSARYKGAFCEAKVKKVNRSVKCKVMFANNLGTFVVPDDQIRGTLRVNMHVEAKHPEKNQFFSAVITKLFDYSQYTVVFDDGDETTLRRTSLCLKSGRHFAESETLDQLPLTNPEHFGIPVIGSKSKRKRRSIASCSSMDGDSSSEELHPKRKKDFKKDYESDIAKVVCVDMGDKRKKDNWFPALIVSPTSQDIKINSKDYYLVRSFKDGKYYQVKKKETRMFTKEIGAKVENNLLKTAVEKANLYLNKDEIPPHWDWDLMMGRDDDENDEQDSDIETSDDEPSEEKDRFVAQLYKFMDERGTPINRAPTVSGRDLNLYKLFNIVQQMGGYNRVTNQNKWRTIYTKMGLIMTNPACSIQIKKAYKRYLHSFEDFNRKLGCTMVSNTRSGHTRYRSDRNIIMTRKREQNLPLMRSRLSRGAKVKNQQKHEESIERRSRLSKIDENENIKQKEESKTNFIEPKREKIETRGSLKNEQEKSKINLSKEKIKKEKPLNGRSKEDKSNKEKAKINTKDIGKERNVLVKVKIEEEKEQIQVKKKIGKVEDKDSGEKITTEESEIKSKRNEAVVRIGDRVRVKYGNGKQHKKYEAKVLKIERESGERKFYVHYTGWNVRYDEWIKKNKIVEVIENKSGSDRKKKGVLWPDSKSKALVKRSKLFKLSLRKNSTSSLAQSSKISKNSSMIPRTRRQENTSTTFMNSSLQTRKLRRKPIDSNKETELPSNKTDSELCQLQQTAESELNSSNETIKLEIMSDTDESGFTKNDNEDIGIEDSSWKEAKISPDDKELASLDQKTKLFTNDPTVILTEEKFLSSSDSVNSRVKTCLDRSCSNFNTSTENFLSSQNIKVEKNWNPENCKELEKIQDVFNPVQAVDELEMPNISNIENARSLNLETVSTKSEYEEKDKMKLNDIADKADSPSLYPLEMWKVEKLHSNSDPVINDEPPPLEMKPDFSSNIEGQYKTRPQLERAVSETEELSCKIPKISIQDHSKVDKADYEDVDNGQSPESCPYRDQITNASLEPELSKNVKSCYSDQSKLEDWVDFDQDLSVVKKEKKKKNKLAKMANENPSVLVESAEFSGGSDPENHDFKEGELKKKIKKEKRKKFKKFGRCNRDTEKDTQEGLEYSKKEKKRDEEQAGSTSCSSSRKGENCKKLKRCRKNKDKSEPFERKAKRKKKKKDVAFNPIDKCHDEDCISSDSDKGTKVKKGKKEKKKSKKKTQPPLLESDQSEEKSIELSGKKSDSLDFVLDSNKSSDDASFLLCQELVPASPVGVSHDSSILHISSSFSSELEQSDTSLHPISELSTDFANNPPSKGPENIQDIIHATTEASTVLDNTPPTTPESTPSYLSSSPTYDHDSISPVGANLPKDADSDSLPGEINKVEVTESEDSLSHTESAILFLANQAVSRKHDTLVKNTNMPKRQLCETDETQVSKRKRTCRNFSSDLYRSNSKRCSKNAKSERDGWCGSALVTESGGVSGSVVSPTRTSKFNFYVPLEAYTDPDKRIAILQESLTELKKTYMALKAEVALIDRHRKKAKRKEKDAAAAPVDVPAQKETAES